MLYLGFALWLVSFPVSYGDLEPTMARCCALGANWGRQGEICDSFPSPVQGEPIEHQSICLTAAAICCLRFYRETHCESGKQTAKSGSDCSPSIGPGGQFAQDCCDGCKLGLMSGSMKMGCTFQGFNFGFPWNDAYAQCCHFSSPVTPGQPTALPGSIPGVQGGKYPYGTPVEDALIPDSENLCVQFPGQLCGHICVAVKGSYKCECRAGFILSTDRKTCVQDTIKDRCQVNNPCDHVCQDTGISIECTCRGGYQLALDQKTCEDVDECLTSSHHCVPLEQVCYNQPGSYSCVNSDGSLSNPGVHWGAGQLPGWDPTLGTQQRTKPSSFGVQGFPGAADESSYVNHGICPPGYIFNLESRACDDVDECSVGLELCGLGVPCENTIGSYTCIQVVTGDCPPGFNFNLNLQTCLDIDECSEGSATCSSSEFCLNTQGSFDCQARDSPTDCPAGYKYNSNEQLCEDVDECEEKLHGCHPESETCRNIIGAYECDLNCGDGFRFKSIPRSCIDINECEEASHNCDIRLEVCLNVIGSFRCESLTGNEVVPTQAVGHSEGHFGLNLPSNNLSPASANEHNCPEGFTMDPITRVCHDINECVTGTHNCSLDTQNCMNILSSFICIAKDKCPVGYEENQITLECQDVDECAQGHGHCMPGQICVNTIGTFECQVECQDGFEYNPRDPAICVDIDECLQQPCSSRDTCTNTEGSFVCSQKETPCNEGFKKVNGQCEDINECLNKAHNCVPDLEQCENLQGSFICHQVRCTRGFYRNITTRECEDVNECANDPCNDNQQCINTPGHFLCRKRPSCGQGFRREETSQECIDIDECVEEAPCGRNERCVNTRGSYNCRSLDCPPGYNRDRLTRQCEDVNECETGEHTCRSHGERCINSPGTYRCKALPPCPRGFTRDALTARCVDVDECAEGTAECLEGERCINQHGRYRCKPTSKHCRRGLKYSIAARRCTDINECDNGSHTCDKDTEKCVNSVGSFRCLENRPACNFGYRYSNDLESCIDINECKEGIDLCLPGAETCINLPGAYRCEKGVVLTTPSTTTTTRTTTRGTTTPKPSVTATADSSKCPSGYSYNPIFKSCLDLDECDTDPCSSKELCINTAGSYICECQDGFTKHASPIGCKDINECQLGLHTCEASQRCDNTLGSYTCTRTASCGTGYTLNHNSGQCEDINECEEDTTDCKSNERCINTVGSYRCVAKLNCGKGYEMNRRGTQCIDVDECDQNLDKCSGGQTCTNRPGGYICQCPTGYRLDRTRTCQDINECTEYYPNVCGSNAECQNTVGSYECGCKGGFQKQPDGKVCSDVDECSEVANACDHKCINTWGSHYCTCNSGYQLASDNSTCVDIDECEQIRGRGKLCLGLCVNTPGTFRCSCPQGYRLDSDKRACKDINECDTVGTCRVADDICVNTRGSYKCRPLLCPDNYVRDPTQRNRCKREKLCHEGDLPCRQQPLMYSYNFLPLASNMTLKPHGEVDLFTMRGPVWTTTNVQFDLQLESTDASAGITQADRTHFFLKRSAFNQVVLKLVKPLMGPQEITLSLNMKLYHNGFYEGSAVSKLTIYVSEYDF